MLASSVSECYTITKGSNHGVCLLPFLGILAVSAILLIAMGILVTMFFSQVIDNFIYKVSLNAIVLLHVFWVTWMATRSA